MDNTPALQADNLQAANNGWVGIDADGPVGEELLPVDGGEHCNDLDPADAV